MGELSQPGFAVTVSPLESLILAAGPSCYYVCDDTGTTLADLSGNGRTLTLTGVADPASTPLIPADLPGRYLRLAAGANIFQRANNLPVPFSGDWTLLCAFAPLDFGTNTINIFTVGGNGETEVLNYQIDFRLLFTTGEIQQFWEHGAGVNDVIASGFFMDEGEVAALACVKDGAANTVTFYKNGVKLSVIAYANEPTGGSDPTVQMGIGDAGTGTVSGEFLLGHCAFYLGQKLSDAQIAAIAHAAGFMGAP